MGGETKQYLCVRTQTYFSKKDKTSSACFLFESLISQGDEMDSINISRF